MESIIDTGPCPGHDLRPVHHGRSGGGSHIVRLLCTRVGTWAQHIRTFPGVRLEEDTGHLTATVGSNLVNEFIPGRRSSELELKWVLVLCQLDYTRIEG